MANNYNNVNNRQRDLKQSIVDGLVDVAIPMDLTGAKFRIDTTTLGEAIADLIRNLYHIDEIDHVFIYPIYNEQRRDVLETFGVAMYFTADRSDGNITRISGKSNSNKGNGPDLMAFVNNRTQSGAFRMNTTFKSVIGGLAVLDKNDNIVVSSDEDLPKLAIIEGDFFKLVSMALKIDENSPYDFDIVECTPLNNKKDCIDYKLTIIKDIVPMKKRSKKSSINYEYRDRKIMQSFRR